MDKSDPRPVAFFNVEQPTVYSPLGDWLLATWKLVVLAFALVIPMVVLTLVGLFAVIVPAAQTVTAFGLPRWLEISAFVCTMLFFAVHAPHAYRSVRSTVQSVWHASGPWLAVKALASMWHDN